MRTSKKVRYDAMCVALIGLLGVLHAAALTDATTTAQSFSIYDSRAASDPSAVGRRVAARELFFSQLRGNGGNPESFAGKARIAFKTESRQVVGQSRTFAVQAPAVLPPGWQATGHVYASAGSTPAPLLLPLTAAPGKAMRAGDFEQFWLDYTVGSNVVYCAPQLELATERAGAAGGTPRHLLASTALPLVPQSFEPRVVIDAVHAGWERKDYGYIAQRLLRAAPDERWRFGQDGQNAVLQRRMHVPLEGVDFLEVVVAAGVNVHRVNLFVATTDDYRAGDLIELTPSAQVLPDGRSGARMNLREALERKFPSHARLYLQEVFVFVPGEAQTMASARALRGMALLSRASTDSTGAAGDVERRPLGANTVELSAVQRRMVVDLRELIRSGEIQINGASLRLSPAPGGGVCATQIDSAVAVSLHNERIPVFARQLEDWARRWGAPVRAMPPLSDRVIEPGIVAYLPLTALAWSDKSRTLGEQLSVKLPPGMQIKFDTEPLAAAPMPYRIYDREGREVAPQKAMMSASSGAALHAGGAFPALASEQGDLLLLEGRSRWLDISWPVDVSIGEDTLFYFGVAEGADQIGSITLTLDLAGRAPVVQRVLPNQPNRLPPGAAHARGLKLRIMPAGTSFRYKLREIALFHPTAVEFGRAFVTPLPTPFTVRPPAILQRPTGTAVEATVGHVAGVLPASEALRFSTAIEPPLDWLRGLHLAYRLPPADGAEPGCVGVQFDWAHGRIDRSICFEQLNGSVFIPFTSLVGGADTRNLGALRSIDWTVDSKTQRGKLALGEFDLRFSLDGWTMLSPADDVSLRAPLFHVGNMPVFTAGNAANGRGVTHYSETMWLPLPEKANAKLAAAAGDIQPVDHALFTLEQVVLEPKVRVDDARWQAMTVPPPTPDVHSSRWPKWILWSVVVLMAFTAWKAGSHVVRLARARVPPCSDFLRVSTHGVAMTLGRWGARLHVVAGLAALGPGLWLSGHYGLTLPGAMLLLAMSIVAWGAYRHWRRGRGLEMHFVRPIWSVAAVAIGSAAWTLGNMGISPGALWALAPLLGAAYAFAPEALPSVRNARPRLLGYLLLTAWIVVTAALYRMGLAANVPSGENYFFVFGGLAAVFALRSASRLIEPHVRALWPGPADRIYGGRGGVYFAASLLLLLAAVAAWSLRRELLAEQLSVIVYYLIVIGTALEAWARLRSSGRED